jgi:hypothetical protein
MVGYVRSKNCLFKLSVVEATFSKGIEAYRAAALCSDV